MGVSRKPDREAVSRSNPDRGPEIIAIPVEPPYAIYGVLWYFGVLAYPDRSDSQKREKFMGALHAWQLKCCSRHIQHASIRIPHDYSRVRKLHGTISKGFRCLERRLTAGSMAWVIYMNGARIPYDWLGLSPQQGRKRGVIVLGPDTTESTLKRAARALPGSVNRTAQALVRARMESTPGLEPEHAAVNIKHRTWAESLLALHLAIALHQRIESLALDCSDEDKLLLLLFRTDWLLETMLHAEGWRTSLPSRIPTFPSDRAIRLLPA